MDSWPWSREEKRPIYIGLTAVLVGLFVVCVGLLIYCCKMKVLQKSRKPTPGTVEVGSVREDNPRDTIAGHEEVITPCCQYEEIDDDETVLSRRRDGRINSNMPGGEVQYEVLRPQISIVNASDIYNEIIDEPSGAAEYEVPVSHRSRSDNANGYIDVIDDPLVTQTSRSDNAHGYIEITDVSKIRTEGYDVLTRQTSTENFSENYAELIHAHPGVLGFHVPVTQITRADAGDHYVELIDYNAGVVGYEVPVSHLSGVIVPDNVTELIDDTSDSE